MSEMVARGDAPASKTGGKKALEAALWIAQILTAAMFFMAGGSKLSGSPMMVAVFDEVGLGQWFRLVTGGLEVAGALLLLVPRTAAAGGALLAAVMVGAVGAHLFVLGGSPAMPLVLLAASLFVAWGRRDRLAAWIARARH
jgi:hypothetical protein